MSWQKEYAALHAELLDHLRWPGRTLKDFRSHPLQQDQVFSELALRLYAFQVRHNRFYGAFVRAAGAADPGSWRDIPPVWTTAFKRARVAAFPQRMCTQYFLTSGTTEAESGLHEFCDPDLYAAGALAYFRAALLADGQRLRMHILTAAPREAPHSSLVFMLDRVRKAFGRPGSRFYLRRGRLATDALVRELRRAEAEGEPVFLLGTAFAFVALLEALAASRLCLRLAAGSRIMETGGFKGRVREVPREEFYGMITAALGVPRTHIVNEYSMTELSSQCYDAGFAQLLAGVRLPLSRLSVKATPPWMRVLVVDPHSGREVEPDERGLIRIYDLANLGSVVAIQTEDIGVRRREGFEVLGRVAAAPLRGCSLDAENVVSGRV